MSRAGGRRGRVLPAAAVGAVVLALAGWFPSLAAAEDTVAFRITDADITESSGLATDDANRRYWTSNDSGDSGKLYALDPDGTLLGTLAFRADVQDVEALAFRNNTIYVADIGDNQAKRDFVTVYTIVDPDPGDAPREYQAYDFAYPGGPRDAEGFFVGSDGRMYIVSKEADGAVYRAPADPSRSAVNQLEKVGDAPAYATDATLLPGGDEVAIRTYVSVSVLDLPGLSTTASVAAPLQPQGESITVGLDGKTLLLGSEGKKSRVYSIPVPTTKANGLPTASASPPTASPSANGSPAPSGSAGPSPTGTTSGDSSDDGDAGDNSTPGNGGTMLALGLAGAVALVAAVIVVAVRKP